jgi:hypothetical protein
MSRSGAVSHRSTWDAKPLDCAFTQQRPQVRETLLFIVQAACGGALRAATFGGRPRPKRDQPCVGADCAAHAEVRGRCKVGSTDSESSDREP